MASLLEYQVDRSAEIDGHDKTRTESSRRKGEAAETASSIEHDFVAEPRVLDRVDEIGEHLGCAETRVLEHALRLLPLPAERVDRVADITSERGRHHARDAAPDGIAFAALGARELTVDDMAVRFDDPAFERHVPAAQRAAQDVENERLRAH